MTNPAELVVNGGNVKEWSFGLAQSTDVSVSVIPLDSEDLAQALLMLLFKSLEMSLYIIQISTLYRRAEITFTQVSKSCTGALEAEHNLLISVGCLRQIAVKVRGLIDIFQVLFFYLDCKSRILVVQNLFGTCWQSTLVFLVLSMRPSWL